MSKQKKILVWLSITIALAGVAHIYYNYLLWVSDPFLREIYNSSYSSNEKRSDIKEIIEKQISNGMPRKEAIRFLASKGFSVILIDPADVNWEIPCESSWYYAERNFSPFLIVKATVYIEIQTTRGIVDRVGGRIWLSGL